MPTIPTTFFQGNADAPSDQMFSDDAVQNPEYTDDALTNPAFTRGGQLSPYSSQANALFARMANQPTNDVKAAIDQFFTDAYMFPKFDIFYLHALANTQQALLNWTNAAYDGVTSGTVTFTPFRGFAGNGTDFYISTGFAPGTLSNYQFDNCCMGGVIQDTLGTGVQNRVLLGYAPTTGSISTIQINSSATNGSKARLNSTASRAFTHTPMEPGHWVCTSSGSGKFSTYRNITTVDTGGTEASALATTTGDFKLFADGDQSGIANTFSIHLGAAEWAGSALTATEVLDFYYALNKLLAVLGAETLVLPPAAQAAITMTPNNPTSGSVVNYSIALDSGTPTGSLSIAQSGTLTDSDFDTTLASAIAAAVASTTGVTYSGGVLTFASTFTGPLTWSRTITSSPAVGATHVIQLSSPATISIKQPYAALLIGQPTFASVPFVRGVNISGAEFDGTAFYPTTATMDYYINHGFTAVRLPHRWERMQPTTFGALAINGDGSGDAEKYKAAVDYLTGHGIYVLIDPHNFGGRTIGSIAYKIGDAGLPVEAFMNYWTTLAAYLGSSPYVIFGLMNEPSGIDANKWYGAAKSTTDILRASGYTNEILVPGSAFTTADSWVSSGNGARFANFFDPLNNFNFEVHQYLDPADSGTTGVCTVGAASRIAAFDTWARSFSPPKTGILGEFAGGDPTVSGQTQCGTEVANTVNYMESRQDVWRGWYPQGGGSYWNNTYIFRIEPIVLTSPDTPIMQMYTPYL